jgi:hypothetical protein
MLQLAVLPNHNLHNRVNRQQAHNQVNKQPVVNSKLPAVAKVPKN